MIGAGGALGQPLLQEFIRRKSDFKSIAVLAATPQRAKDFASLENQGVKIIVGSYLVPESFTGTIPLLALRVR